MKRRSRWLRFGGSAALAALTATAGLLPLTSSPASAATITTTRYAGATRYGTAEDIATGVFGTASTAILATGLNFPDALAASYLAGNLNAPVLLTDPNALSPEAAAALGTLKTSNVIIVGGTDAVSDAVVTSLEATASTAAAGGNLTVTRISGATRFDTAAAIDSTPAATTVGTFNGKKTAILATGNDFPDALFAGPLSYSSHFPIILTDSATLSPQAATELTSLGIQQVIIMGGTAAVSAAVESAVNAAGVTTLFRSAGANRDDTAAKLLVWETTNISGVDKTSVYIARDDSPDGFADALAMGPAAGKLDLVGGLGAGAAWRRPSDRDHHGALSHRRGQRHRRRHALHPRRYRCSLGRSGPVGGHRAVRHQHQGTDDQPAADLREDPPDGHALDGDGGTSCRHVHPVRVQPEHHHRDDQGHGLQGLRGIAETPVPATGLAVHHWWCGAIDPTNPDAIDAAFGAINSAALASTLTLATVQGAQAASMARLCSSAPPPTPAGSAPIGTAAIDRRLGQYDLGSGPGQRRQLPHQACGVVAVVPCNTNETAVDFTFDKAAFVAAAAAGSPGVPPRRLTAAADPVASTTSRGPIPTSLTCDEGLPPGSSTPGFGRHRGRWQRDLTVHHRRCGDIHGPDQPRSCPPRPAEQRSVLAKRRYARAHGSTVV